MYQPGDLVAAFSCQISIANGFWQMNISRRLYGQKMSDTGIRFCKWQKNGEMVFIDSLNGQIYLIMNGQLRQKWWHLTPKMAAWMVKLVLDRLFCFHPNSMSWSPLLQEAHMVKDVLFLLRIVSINLEFFNVLLEIFTKNKKIFKNIFLKFSNEIRFNSQFLETIPVIKPELPSKWRLTAISLGEKNNSYFI